MALAAYSRAYANGREALITTMLKATRLLALYGLAAATTLAVIARDAVPVLFSEQWDAAVTPMMLISLSLGSDVDRAGPVATCSSRWADCA